MGAFLSDNLRVVRINDDRLGIVPLHQFFGVNVPYDRWLYQIKQGTYDIDKLIAEDTTKMNKIEEQSELSED